MTSSVISCRMRDWSRRSGIASASRLHTPSFHSASRNSSSPPSEDWFPPAKSTVSFLRWTAGRSKGSSVASVMTAVARRRYASTRGDSDLLRESRVFRYSRRAFLTSHAYFGLDADIVLLPIPQVLELRWDGDVLILVRT